MDGIQRLAEMIKGQKDKYLIKTVTYLMSQKQMEKDFLKEEKNLKDMAKYITSLAEKEAVNIGAVNKVAVLEDEDVYNWAKEYFIKSNEELGIKKCKVKKGKHADIIKTEIKEEDDEFGSIFEEGQTVNNIEKKNKYIEQISLFSDAL